MTACTVKKFLLKNSTYLVDDKEQNFANRRVTRRRHSDVACYQTVNELRDKKDQNTPHSINDHPTYATRQKQKSSLVEVSKRTDLKQRRMTMYVLRHPDTEDFSRNIAIKSSSKGRRSKRYSLDHSQFFNSSEDSSRSVMDLVEGNDKNKSISSATATTDAIHENTLLMDSLSLSNDGLGSKYHTITKRDSMGKRHSKRVSPQFELCAVSTPQDYETTFLADPPDQQNPKRRRSLRRSKSEDDLRMETISNEIVMDHVDTIGHKISKTGKRKRRRSFPKHNCVDGFDEIRDLYLNKNISKTKSNLETIFEDNLKKNMSQRKYKRFINFNDCYSEARRQKRILKALKINSFVKKRMV